MFTKIHHMGILVRDLEPVVEVYQKKLGLTLGATCELSERGVCVAFFPVGESQIEFVQPLPENEGLLKVLEKRGEGLHHICLEVEDIHAALQRLKEEGVPLIDETPRPGADGWVAFVHPKAMHGVLIELLQPEAPA